MHFYVFTVKILFGYDLASIKEQEGGVQCPELRLSGSIRAGLSIFVLPSLKNIYTSLQFLHYLKAALITELRTYLSWF